MIAHAAADKCGAHIQDTSSNLATMFSKLLGCFVQCVDGESACIQPYNKPVERGSQSTDAVLKAVAMYLGPLPCIVRCAAPSVHSAPAGVAWPWPVSAFL